MNIKDIKNLSLEEIIRLIDKGDITDAVVYTLPLDTALTNFQVEIAGNFIACVASTDLSVNVDIEFNKFGSGKINFTQGLSFSRPYARFFITSSAQSGKTITFILSSYAPELFAIQDNRSNALQAQYLSNIQDELRGNTTPQGYDHVAVSSTAPTKVIALNAARKAFIIQQLETNTGDMYIGFNDTVAADKFVYKLRKGSVDSFALDDYRGDIYLLAAVNAEKVAYGEW